MKNKELKKELPLPTKTKKANSTDPYCKIELTINNYGNFITTVGDNNKINEFKKQSVWDHLKWFFKQFLILKLKK